MTLTQILCFDNTFSIIRAMFHESRANALLVILFILIAALTLLNILIGVICEIVAVTNLKAREQMLYDHVNYIFEQLDMDSNGLLTLDEVDTPAARSVLARTGVEEDMFIECFKLIDVNDDARLDVDEFKDVLIKLARPAQTEDIVLIEKKLQKLELAAKSSGFSIGAAVTEKQTKLAQEIESRLAELEELTAHTAPETTASTATGPNLEQSLQALDESFHALHANLECCADPTARIVAGRYLVDS